MEGIVWPELGTIVVTVALVLAILGLFAIGRLLFSAIVSKFRKPARPLFTPKSQMEAEDELAKAKHKPAKPGKTPVTKLAAGTVMDNENAPCFIHGVPKQMCKEKHQQAE